MHTTQKPEPLMVELVTLFTDPGETILDPFMGSGTTGVAATLCGRAFLGCEINPHHFDTACRRVEHAQHRKGLAHRQQPLDFSEVA